MTNLLNFKSFLKFLSKNKSYTFIDVFGLSISLMFVILISVYIKQELSTDNFQENKEQIYAFSNGQGFGTAYKIAYRMEERCPEIEKVCPITLSSQNVAEIGDTKIAADYMLVDTTFFDMFSFELSQGNRETVLSAKNYAVISETFANKAFPGEDPIGKTIKVHNELSVTVNGVMKDIKNSVIKYADILFRIDNVGLFNSSIDSDTYNNAGSTIIFLKEVKGANIHNREEELAEYFKEIFWLYMMGLNDKVIFVPLEEMYFSDLSGDWLINQGDWKFVMILLSVGILILVFAIINYINLTVAQTGFRAKEMAIRRLLGSSRWELFMRLIMESTLLTLISFIIAMVLAFAFVPVANNLLETRIFLKDMFTLPNIIMTLLVIFSIGTLAGLLPAIIISNSRPVDVVKGGFRTKTKMVFSKIFITFQNVITIALIAASITMIWQIQHLINAPLGYNTTSILEFSRNGLSNDDLRLLRNELEQLSVVKSVAFAEGTPFQGGNNSTTTYNDMNVAFQILIGDSAYYYMLGLQILQDNNLSNDDGFYLNESAFRMLGIPDDASSITAGTDWVIPIAGKIRDFQLRDAEYESRPILFQIKQTNDMRPWSVLVEVQGNEKQAEEQIKAVYERMTGLAFESKFMDQRISEFYAPQKRTSKIVIGFAFVAIVISMLGLLAMSTYFIQQRSREVAVRKVFGSTNGMILQKLVLTFLNYAFIAFVIACPVIWYIMSQWLYGYKHRISLSPLIFIAAGLFCVLISFVTVYWQSRKAANSNPANSIKAE